MKNLTLCSTEVEYKFKTNSMALPDVEACFSRLLIIKGRIGSGKTLLLKTLGGAYTPDSGSVSLAHADGRVAEGYFVHSQAEFNFVTGFVGDELEFAGVPKEPFEKYLKRNVNEMSGGELKSLSVRMAVYAARDVLLLDEPLDMLDDAQAEAMAAYIVEASYNKPMIIATHDNHFDKYADCIVYIDSGEAEEPVAPEKSASVGGKNLLTSDNLSVELEGQKFPEISLRCHSGEIVCLYGRNGSGKTLFTRSIAGIGRYAYSGSYEWGLPREERGVCLQFPEQMAYQENVSQEIADMAGKDRVAEVLAVLGWESRAECSPFALSDGEKRTMYVISLLVKNGVCVFDEPFAGLDRRSMNFIISHFYKARARGAGILYTANRLEDTVYADTIVKI